MRSQLVVALLIWLGTGFCSVAAVIELQRMHDLSALAFLLAGGLSAWGLSRLTSTNTNVQNAPSTSERR
jgi:hypothetical protein